jgi:PPOX class probable F420-dependent enzyme
MSGPIDRAQVREKPDQFDAAFVLEWPEFVSLPCQGSTIRLTNKRTCVPADAARENPRNEETVMAAIPAEYLDLVQQKAAFAHLATIMPDGTPQVTPVWFDYKDGKIRINSAKGRVKVRNMGKGAPVALSILDPDNAYRYIQIRGRVEHVTEEGADAHIDSLAKKYLGKDKYPWASPDQVRVIFEIEPGKVQAQG